MGTYFYPSCVEFAMLFSNSAEPQEAISFRLETSLFIYNIVRHAPDTHLLMLAKVWKALSKSTPPDHPMAYTNTIL
jgi:hypothetical protein